MISLDRVGVTYADEPAPALSGVDLAVPEGELVLVVGRTGSGKSTLLRTLNGLVPHFSGGTLHGRVVVDGRDTRTHRPRDLADVVGYVGQDPLAGFVTDTVEEELAYGMESLGLPPDVMRKRVEETLDLLGLAEVRDRAVADLSGGQQQRVAIGSVLTTHPRLLVLDEPTSALDVGRQQQALEIVDELRATEGLTVLSAMHDLTLAGQYADRLLLLDCGRLAAEGSAREVLTRALISQHYQAEVRVVGDAESGLVVVPVRVGAKGQ
jgi:energy-coupling factor transport system ATP-binding protein